MQYSRLKYCRNLQDLIRSIPYHRLVSFGVYHNDFMLTIERVLPPQAHPEETARERLTFSMPAKNIVQVNTISA